MKTLAKLVCGFLGCIGAMLAQAQDSSALTLTAYGEVYYMYTAAKSHTRPPFIYSHNRAREVAVNLALLKASYNADRMRANLGLMAGTYSNANLAAEPGVLKNLFEANGGYKIHQSKNLWVDAGVLPSHIGFESAIGKDSWTLTRSLAADNSPYYETGVRLSYGSSNQKWYAALLFLNGWQRIQRPEGNFTPAFGSQLTFKPSEQLTLNSSTFIGSDQPDSTRKMRYFHNLYGIWQVNNWLGITVGLDAGGEQQETGASSLYYWYTPVVIFRTTLHPGKFIAARIEHYSDRNAVIVQPLNGKPFSVWGYSANLDWQLQPNLLWRIEGRILKSKYDLFLDRHNNPTSVDVTTTTALCFSF